MCSIKCYSFSRLLTQIEWTILRSYTYRIRSILDEDDTLNWESVGTFLNPPTTESLFSNLRYLRAGGLTEINIQHFLCMSFPSLVTLDVWFVAKETLCPLQDSLESFFKSSPNIRRLSIQLRGLMLHLASFSPIISADGETSRLWSVVTPPWTWTLLHIFPECLH